MAVGYYATIMRGQAGRKPKVGFLVGPFDDEPTARARIPDARRLAEQHDPFTAFDFFGTARLERDTLPAGIFNAKLEVKF